MEINLQRRIKRNAWPKRWEMFAVCPPGLEPVLAAEMEGLGLEDVRPDEGGAAFSEKLDMAYWTNLWLRSASRVLIRLADFRVRRFEDLERQASAAPWEFFLPGGAALSVRASLHGSNLRHQGRVEAAVLKAVANRLKELGIKPPSQAGAEDAGQSILVRAVDRRAMISLDTSGEHLHRRGYRQQTAKAPIRENLAAALLMLAGYDGAEQLLDPLTGAGTFAIEAALLARLAPPGLHRDFAMLHWPAHREKTWQHLKKLAQEQAAPRPASPIIARDIDAGAITAASHNAALAGVANCITIERGDFFASPPPPGPPGLVVLNPPYGRRLGSVRQAEQFAARLGQHLRKNYPGWRVAAVLYLPKWLELLGLEEAHGVTVPHGGMKVNLVAGRVGR